MLGHLGLREVHEMVIKAIRARDGYLGEGTKGEDFIHFHDPLRDNLAPETTSDTCFNVLPDSEGNLHPGCIVGSAFIEAGISTSRFESMKSYCAWPIIDNFIDRGLIESTTEAAGRFLTFAQSKQDGGSPWGEAVMFALNLVHRNYETDADADREFLIEMGYDL